MKTAHELPINGDGNLFLRRSARELSGNARAKHAAVRANVTLAEKSAL